MHYTQNDRMTQPFEVFYMNVENVIWHIIKTKLINISKKLEILKPFKSISEHANIFLLILNEWLKLSGISYPFINYKRCSNFIPENIEIS